MNVFPLNSAVSVTMRLVDFNDSPVVPTGLSYVLLDEEDEVLIAATTVAITSGMTEVVLDLPPTANDFHGARTIELTVETATSLFVLSDVYAIVPSQRLVFLENSFQTYSGAELLARDIPNMDGWEEGTREQKCVAMIEAFSKLCQLYYNIPYPELADSQSRLDANVSAEIQPNNWPEMTSERFNEYPDRFILALRKAQLVEASQILAGDPIADKMRSGLFSEKIGESSMMFRSGTPPLKLPVSRLAFQYLTGYISNRMVISRS